MKNNAELARAAIIHSSKRHITREAALTEILKKEKLDRPSWMTSADAKVRRKTLVKCVLALIPWLEPNKINANFKGKVRNAAVRLKRMEPVSGTNGSGDLCGFLKKHHESEAETKYTL